MCKLKINEWTGFFLMLYSPRLAADGLPNCKQCAEREKAVTQSQ